MKTFLSQSQLSQWWLSLPAKSEEVPSIGGAGSSQEESNRCQLHSPVLAPPWWPEKGALVKHG